MAVIGNTAVVFWFGCAISLGANQQACDGCVLEHCKSQPGTPKAICDPESPDRNVCQACQKDYLLDQVIFSPALRDALLCFGDW